MIEANETRLKLRSVVLRCQALRGRIKHAARLDVLSPIVLGALKKKMEALQVNFRDACSEVSIQSYTLIDSSLDEWW